jgi:hypothetical protein
MRSFAVVLTIANFPEIASLGGADTLAAPIGRPGLNCLITDQSQFANL